MIAIAVKHIVAAQAVLLGLAVQLIAVEHQLLAVHVLRIAGKAAEGKGAVGQGIEQGIGAVVALRWVFQRAGDVQTDKVRQAEWTVQRCRAAR
ncbi:hypothetical protein D3C78_1199240 [compost metagenome]